MLSTRDRPARGIWMDPAQLTGSPKWQDTPSSVIVGRDAHGGLLSLNDDRHLLTVAGSRAGKGLSMILPNLARYGGSVCVLDPKGENATLTAECRGQGRGIAATGLGQDVAVIDPFRVADVAEDLRAGFNPVADLDPASPRFIDDCYSIADALVIATAKDMNDHWNSTARLVLRGFVAWVATGDDRSRNLVELRRLLHQHPDDFSDLLDKMMEAPERAAGVPAEMAAALVGMGPDEQGSVLSTVRQNTLFLSSPPMAECLSGNVRAPDLKAWKFGGSSIYLCLPAGLMTLHARFFRLFVNRLLAAVESTPEKGSIPALLLLDEVHVLGHMAQLETAAGLMAGYGLRIHTIWQDFSQAEAIYGVRWQTFLGNASLFQAFGLNDLKTLRYVSDRLGSTLALTTSTNQISVGQATQGFDGKSTAMTTTPLLTADEVAYHFSRQSGAQVIFYPGAAPIWMRRASWLDDDFKQYRRQDQ
jgi:type IV secretion system protein VirD4